MRDKPANEERVTSQLTEMLRGYLENHSRKQSGRDFDSKWPFNTSSKRIAEQFLNEDTTIGPWEERNKVFDISRSLFRNMLESDRLGWNNQGEDFLYSIREAGKSLTTSDIRITFREVSKETFSRPPLDPDKFPDITNAVLQKLPEYFVTKLEEEIEADIERGDVIWKKDLEGSMLASSSITTYSFLKDFFDIEIPASDDIPQHFLPIKRRFYDYFEELLRKGELMISGKKYRTTEMMRTGLNLSIIFIRDT